MANLMQRNFIYFINPISGTKNKTALVDYIHQQTSIQNITYQILDTNKEGNYQYLPEKIKDEQIYADTWSSIIANDGSCQHLDILDENQKEVFKTSMEIDQRWVIELAADRQQYIDQAQSLNLFFR